ncbi:hypothetical protein [Sphingomonas sp. Leaf357]|uniref:hypothetical protein n=1 Tax=Sphingomonas sp. Leaf357 TaxID=1736350 RepID=UPI001F404002|nr:hypothetical protein [Sphingomonas sp. Leaf357]
MARIITRAWAFDLRYLGPEIGEELAAPWAGEDAGEFEDLYAGKGFVRHCHPRESGRDRTRRMGSHEGTKTRRSDLQHRTFTPAEGNKNFFLRVFVSSCEQTSSALSTRWRWRGWRIRTRRSP